MIPRLVLAAVLLAAAATASAAPAPPTDADFNAARTAAASPDKSAMVQCIRFRNLQCQAGDQPQTYSCAYEEIGDNMGWSKKNAVLAWRENHWALAGGDAPRCAVLGGALGSNGAGSR